MRRNVSSRITLTTSAGAAELELMVAVARIPGLDIDEELSVTLDGTALLPIEHVGRHKGVVHVLDLPAGTPAGQTLEIAYRARVDGEGAVPHPPLAQERTELFTYRRPSRYAESDRLRPLALSEFRGLRGWDLVTAVSSWVGTQLSYVPGSSRVTDGAVETFLARRGVCRDYAHLVVALLRALDVPARVAAVYAPGLSPMDFHAVAEVWVDEDWHVVDATSLAPRETLLRIATGRDAADTAFLSSYGASLRLTRLSVNATVAGDLPADDLDEMVRLS
ncbi:transglutaminase-like domain-containing protein [Georgenia muralis]|uniref:Transglutaminase superfamily protein n=1 Tax=Georgenia muralis TaxID=154117 RepID=A0A3N4Z801_9MICO|nr:transglutaminase family protein [Georgenia muralis]RPF27330.1 transglutaminase superfamily protein [Georgenia muralis]